MSIVFLPRAACLPPPLPRQIPAKDPRPPEDADHGTDCKEDAAPKVTLATSAAAAPRSALPSGTESDAAPAPKARKRVRTRKRRRSKTGNSIPRNLQGVRELGFVTFCRYKT